MDGGTWWAAVHGVTKRRERLSDFTFTFHFDFSLSRIGEGNGNPLQYSCLENPKDSRAWWAAVCGVTQSRTWLKWLSSSSINIWYLFFSVSDLLYFVLQFLDPFTSQQMAQFHSFYGWVIFHSIHVPHPLNLFHTPCWWMCWNKFISMCKKLRGPTYFEEINWDRLQI